MYFSIKNMLKKGEFRIEHFTHAQCARIERDGIDRNECLKYDDKNSSEHCCWCHFHDDCWMGLPKDNNFNIIKVNKKGEENMLMRNLYNLTRYLTDRELRLLVRSNLMLEDGEFTSLGKNLITFLMFKDIKDQVIKEAEDIIKEEQEDKFGFFMSNLAKPKSLKEGSSEKEESDSEKEESDKNPDDFYG